LISRAHNDTQYDKNNPLTGNVWIKESVNFFNDFIKRELLQIDRLLDTLQNLHLITITKDDLIKFRGAGYRQKIHFGQEGHDRVTNLISQATTGCTARFG
jgi:hypothetical protein